jgi:hypothetical protein
MHRTIGRESIAPAADADYKAAENNECLLEDTAAPGDDQTHPEGDRSVRSAQLTPGKLTASILSFYRVRQEASPKGSTKREH